MSPNTSNQSNSLVDHPNKMVDQIRKAEQFRAFHVPGKPLVLFNVWDAGSTKAVAAAGAKAIATGSWSVAHANGFEDGEKVPLVLAIENLRRIVGKTNLPVSVDLESGYADSVQAVGQTISLAIDAGAIGCNLEDSFPSTGKLRETADQANRIRRARQAADALNIPLFINARTDVFFQTPPGQHDESMLAEAIDRAKAYTEVGANGLFAPGLTKLDLITRLVRQSPLPVNIMVSEGTPPLNALADQGVARVSHGPGPYMVAMKALQEAAAREQPQ
jgi:2-methylisocitrate lyase-like PEP mutase family enzyme